MQTYSLRHIWIGFVVAFVGVTMAAPIHAQNGLSALNAVGAVGTAGAIAGTAIDLGASANSGGFSAFDSSGILSGASAGVTGADMLAILEGAAQNGQPLALWRLGMMYENGTGVEQDRVRAFGYFSQIANQHADTPPRSIEAGVVAQSFVKIGDYYRVGLPGAGIAADEKQSRALLFHAASYFGDADAQYRLGLLFLDENEQQRNALQGARWLSLAAHKGHLGAQAVLGDLLFNGEDGIHAQPVEGLMWLSLAHEATLGGEDEVWIGELLTRAMSIASPDQRIDAISAADSVRDQLSIY